MRQRGFTLIELVIVIVILGILAVTAAPRFLDLTGDARTSTLEGLEGTVKSAADIASSKAAIDGVQDDTGASVTIDGTTVNMEYGYPEASSNGILAVLNVNAATDGAEDWVYVQGSTDTQFFMAPSDAISIAGTDATETEITDSNCYLQYDEAADANSSPTYTLTTSGC